MPEPPPTAFERLTKPIHVNVWVKWAVWLAIFGAVYSGPTGVVVLGVIVALNFYWVLSLGEVALAGLVALARLVKILPPSAATDHKPSWVFPEKGQTFELGSLLAVMLGLLLRLLVSNLGHVQFPD